MKQGSAVLALRQWMLACIDEGDFEKAYRIRKVIDQASKLTFITELYHASLQRRNWALARFNSAVGDDVVDASQEWRRAELGLGSAIDFIKKGGGCS